MFGQSVWSLTRSPPAGLRNSATGEALQAIIDLDLNELLVVELPRGFGRV
jgi:hypothetical protein